MQCLNPLHIQDGEGFLAVPCGKCRMCKVARAREWALRISHELAYHDSAVFATLTYRDEELPPDLSLSKTVFQGFMKRLRGHYEPKRLKYFGCGEYGSENLRPHYHAILFGVPFEDHRLVLVDPEDESKGWRCLSGPVLSCWGNGFVVLGTVTYKSARYCVEYLQKSYDKAWNAKVYGSRVAPFQVQSRGLGRRYALEHRSRLQEEMTCTVEGESVGLPRYYQKVVLDSDEFKDRFHAKAAQAELDGRFYWARKGVHEGFEQTRLMARERRQRARNVFARLDRKAKGSTL